MHSGVCPAGAGPFLKLLKLFLIKFVLHFVVRTKQCPRRNNCVVLVALSGRKLGPQNVYGPCI